MSIFLNRSIRLACLLTLVYLKSYSQAPTISYTGSPYTFIIGASISTLTPTVTGSPVINGQTSTVAGTGSAGYVNGTGGGASFNQPIGIVVDAAGNLYISDVGNEVIRKITPGGVVSTFAGTGTPGSTNGTGTSAAFYHPVQMCIDAAGNIYIADEDNNMIRKMTPAGVVTTLAGQATAGFTNATGTSAQFNLPCGVAVDASGNVYVADYNNNAIRKITPAGVVSTFAGSITGASGSANGTGTAATFHNPFSLAIDASANLYVADRSNNMIRKITSAGVVTTLAGQTAGGHTNGTGTAASFYMPTTVTTDVLGNVYVADEGNNMIRKITPAGLVSTLSGASFDDDDWVDGVGTAAMFYNPFAVATDPYGNVFVCDLTKDLIRKVVSTPYTINPALPTGLSFNTATGVISGTPTAVSSTTAYSISDYNSSGMGSVSVNITVSATGINPSSNNNYVVTYVPRISGITTTSAVVAASANNTQVETNVAYFDGLGRPLQTVQVKASTAGKDIVQPFAYDQFGREATKYLPYALTGSTTSDGSYRPTAINDQSAFYASPPSGVSSNTYANSSTNFEPSPLDRPIEQGAPGGPWQLSTSGVSGSGHTSKIVYTSNNTTALTDTTNTLLVPIYTVTISGETRTLVLGSGSLTNYAAGQLYVTIGKDENWVSGRAGTVEEYKDKLGHIILKRNYNYAGGLLQMLSTYYVYDDLGNLAFVLPPASGADSALPSQTILNNLCYQYRYDSRNRLTQKKIPGKGWEFTIYNTLDQVVMTQDANQRNQTPQQWTFTKYDGQGRPIITGLWTYPSSTADNNANSPSTTELTWLENLYLTTTNPKWENWLGTTTTGYDGLSDPQGQTFTNLSVNYYDKYPGSTYIPAAYSPPTGASTMTAGLQTGNIVNVLGTSVMLCTVNYFDDLARMVKNYHQHYLGAVSSVNNYDAVTTTYNFTDQPTTITRQHWNTGNTSYPLVAIANKYLYDQVGRKLKTWEQITNLNTTPTTPTLISKIDYNEIGQVSNKHLHSTDSTTYLQTITYSYNERGWLLISSAPLFVMNFYYNTSTYKAYNGNIMYQIWGTTAGMTKGSNFLYDKLNRLVSGVLQTENPGVATNSEQGIAYDLQGNLTALSRYDATRTLIDNLGYTYTGNQLQSVNDGSGNNNGLVSGTTSYTYDGNGNMLTQANTSNQTQSKIFTYNILNLPQSAADYLGTLTYTYDASGNKLRRKSTGLGNSTDYISGIQYDGATTPTLSFIQTEEGKAVPNGTGYDYVYYLGDNLGNTRITFGTKTGAAVSYQSDDYYPFGMEINNSVLSPKNEYLYNKKELQEELQEYDYGARFYDPVIGRWNTIDKLAEKYYSSSEYVYVNNNPVITIDPDGNDGVKIIDQENKVITVKAVYFVQSANYKGGVGQRLYSDGQIQKFNGISDELNKAGYTVTEGEYKGYTVKFDLEFKKGGYPDEIPDKAEAEKYDGVPIGNTLQLDDKYSDPKDFTPTIIKDADGNETGEQVNGGSTRGHKFIKMNDPHDTKKNRIHELFHSLFFDHDHAPNGIGHYPPEDPNQNDINTLINNNQLPTIEKKKKNDPESQ